MLDESRCADVNDFEQVDKASVVLLEGFVPLNQVHLFAVFLLDHEVYALGT